MVKVTKTVVDEKTSIFIVKDVTPEFDGLLQKVIHECNGLNLRFEAGPYQGLTTKEAYYKDGKQAVITISGFLQNTYNPDYFNNLKSVLKMLIKNDRKEYSLEEVLALRTVLNEEISEYENRFSINLDAEIQRLEGDEKDRIRDFILF